MWKVRRCFTVMKPHFHSEMDIRCDFDSFIHEPAFLQHWWERQLRCREWVWRNRNGRRGLNSDKVCDTLCWQGVLRGRSHQWPHQVPTSNGARYGCVCVCVWVCMSCDVMRQVWYYLLTGTILCVDKHPFVCLECVDKHIVCLPASYCVLTNILCFDIVLCVDKYHTVCWQTYCILDVDKHYAVCWQMWSACWQCDTICKCEYVCWQRWCLMLTNAPLCNFNNMY